MARKACRKFTRAATACLLVLLGTTGCNVDVGPLHDAFIGKDRNPPIVLSVESISSQCVVCTFDEPVRQDGSFRWLADGESPEAIAEDGATIRISTKRFLPKGARFVVEGRVRDDAGNSTWFSVPCWGCNETLAGLKINEFTTKGTDANPDRTELLVTDDGDIAGATLSNGPLDTWDTRIILPSQAVCAGDYIVVWWKGHPKIQSECNEDGTHTYSFAVDGSPGLSANNGALVLTENPAAQAAIVDAVVYTNRETTTYDGFGSKPLQEMVRHLVASGYWKCADTAAPDASCGIDSTHTSATRSMARVPGLPDTDCASDWFVTETRGATFGEANTDRRYER